jgi:glutamyl-tRNA synthetase
MATSVRTRIAPSPTGDPHVGTAYVALFNRALARKHGGQFVLRIEDTDRERSHRKSEAMIFEALRWLGLDWDEGPDVGGPFGPYRQSERSEVYRRHADELLQKGAAYPCFCTRERLDSLREEQKAKKQNFGYDGRCRELDPPDAAKRRAAGEAHVVRLKMPRDGEHVVHDLLRGEIRIGAAQVDDQVLLKSDGFPTYHLAVVVDDHLMQISHVIRAEEWLSSLPKHFQLYKGFGWEPPIHCHLPLLRNADRSKISKRKNPVSLNHYRRAGFLPEAMLNYLALMGFSMGDDKEEFGLAEFEAVLQLERISLGGPVFDVEKLRWLNGRYLRRLSPDQLLERLRREPLSDEYMLKVLPLVQERVDTLEAFFDYAAFFFVGEIAYDLDQLAPKGHTPADYARVLRAVLEEHFDSLPGWDAATLEAALRAAAEAAEWPAKDVMGVVRVAATGRAATPPLFETLAVLGKEIVRRRLKAAIEFLRAAKASR